MTNHRLPRTLRSVALLAALSSCGAEEKRTDRTTTPEQPEETGGSGGRAAGSGGRAAGSGGSTSSAGSGGSAAGSGGSTAGSGGSTSTAGSGGSTAGSGGSTSTAGSGGSTSSGGSAGSGGAGGSSTGGTGGASDGGAPADAGPVTPACMAATPIISDLENGMATIAGECVMGSWWLSADKTGTLSPAPSTLEKPLPIVDVTGRTGSKKGIRFMGKGQTGYVVLSASLNNGTLPHDASRWKGVTFWVKGSGTIRVGVVDKNSDPAGGVCTAEAGPMQCYNHFGKDITLGSTWKQETLLFDQISQQAGWGYQVPSMKIDQANIYAVNFQIMIPWKDGMSQPAPAYDVWVDDLAFVP